MLMDTNIIGINDYQVEYALGAGGQANIFLCKKLNCLYAAKVFRQESSSYLNQSKIIQILNHKNIVHACQSMETASIKFQNEHITQRPTIMFSFYEKGDLFQLLKTGGPFKLKFCKFIISQILQGLQYMSDLGICHRDIKPENILLDENFGIKIGDFGLANFKVDSQAHQNNSLNSLVGTQGYRAPQVAQGNYQGEKVDVFALGVLFFQIFAGFLPFSSTKFSNQNYRFIMKNDYQKFWHAQQKNRPKGFFSLDFKKFVNKILNSNPESRPSIKSLIKDKWLSQEVATFQQYKIQMQQRYQNLLSQNRNMQKLTSYLSNFQKLAGKTDKEQCTISQSPIQCPQN